MIRHLNEFYLETEKKWSEVKALAGKEEVVTQVCQEKGMFDYFCGLHSNLVFVCVLTGSQTGLFKILLHRCP